MLSTTLPQTMLYSITFRLNLQNKYFLDKSAFAFALREGGSWKSRKLSQKMAKSSDYLLIFLDVLFIWLQQVDDKYIRTIHLHSSGGAGGSSGKNAHRAKTLANSQQPRDRHDSSGTSRVRSLMSHSLQTSGHGEFSSCFPFLSFFFPFGSFLLISIIWSFYDKFALYKVKLKHYFALWIQCVSFSGFQVSFWSIQTKPNRGRLVYAIFGWIEKVFCRKRNTIMNKMSVTGMLMSMKISTQTNTQREKRIHANCVKM